MTGQARFALTRRSAAAGVLDITNVPTDFSAHATGRLEVVSPARIAGTVIDFLEQPVRAPWILMMSAEPALQQEWATTNHMAQGNTQGSFSVAVMPGRYLVPLFRRRRFGSIRLVDARKGIRGTERR